MARKKKDGKRAPCIQAKKGYLYIITNESIIENGNKIIKKRWIKTGLPDTAENITKALAQYDIFVNGEKVNRLSRDTTMSLLIENYLTTKKRDVRETSHNAYVNRCKVINDHFGCLKIKDITKKDIEQFLDQLFFREKVTKTGEIKTVNRSTRYVKDIRGQLIALYKFAMSHGVVRANLAEMVGLNESYKIRFANEKDDSEVFFNEEEIVYFLDVIKNHPLYWFYYFIILYGLRREEALGLRWRCINWAKKTITISHTVARAKVVVRLDATKKEASKRTYPLTDDMINVLRDIKKDEDKNRKLFGDMYNDTDYIFKHKDGSLYFPDTVTKAFRAIKEAHPELPQAITLHGLRKSCISLLVHLGYSVKEIQDWVGQRDEATTLKIYAKIKSAESKTTIAERLSGIIQPKR